MFLPSEQGRLQYVVEVVAPGPWEASEMPEAVRDLRVTRVHGFVPRKGVPVEAARVTRLSPPEGGREAMEVAMLEDLGRYITSADCDLGRVRKGDGQAAAGALSGLRQGETELGGHRVEVSSVLGHLGPLFDGSLWLETSLPLADELEEAGWRVQSGFLIFTRSWEERNQALAELTGDPGLPAEPGWEIRSPAEHPPLSASVRLLLAAALVLGGLCLLAWQLRGISREEVAHRLGRK